MFSVKSIYKALCLFTGTLKKGPDPTYYCIFYLVGRQFVQKSAAFAQRRKTLTNALSSVCEKSKTEEALTAMGLRTDIRGEKLSAADFVTLAKHIRGLA